jgi:hypothetical protein
MLFSEAKKEDFYNPPNIYSPRAVHEKVVVCCRDDLESWIYCQLALWSRSVLPWKRARNKLMYKFKTKFFMTPEELISKKKLPGTLLTIVDLIKKMKRNDEPQYEQIGQLLDGLKAEIRVTSDEAFNWIERSKQSSEPSKELSTENEPKKRGSRRKCNRSSSMGSTEVCFIKL